MKTGAQWNPFDIKLRVSKSNLETNENDFFAKDNYYDIKMNKCVEKRGIKIPITRCIRNVSA